MSRGGLIVLFSGAAANTLTCPATFVLIRVSYGEIASTALTGVHFNFLARLKYTVV